MVYEDTPEAVYTYKLQEDLKAGDLVLERNNSKTTKDNDKKYFDIQFNYICKQELKITQYKVVDFRSP